jgi:hypothetical protein
MPQEYSVLLYVRLLSLAECTVTTFGTIVCNSLPTVNPTPCFPSRPQAGRNDLESNVLINLDASRKGKLSIASKTFFFFPCGSKTFAVFLNAGLALTKQPQPVIGLLSALPRSKISPRILFRSISLC